MRELENGVNANNSKQSTLPKVRATQAVVARRAVMEFSDDSDLSNRSKTRLKALLGRAKEMERYRRDSEEWRESF